MQNIQVMNGNVFIPVGKPTGVSQGNLSRGPAGVPQNQQSFGEILSKKIDENDALQFSKHAEMRLKSRDITLTREQMQRAADGVAMAKTKGIRDSLVLIDDVALVINTKSNVVITALEGKMDSVFTNIDGAVIV